MARLAMQLECPGRPGLIEDATRGRPNRLEPL